MKNPNSNSRPTHSVYVVEGEGEKAFWTKVGAAWQHADGEGFNVSLSAISLNGRLVVPARARPAIDESIVT
jgi:hypothetical protein